MTPDQIVKLESGRWEILRVLHVGGHIGATEAMVLATLRALWIEVSQSWVRDQLAYLEARRLIEIDRPELEPWRAKLTRHGWDVATYVVDCAPGIARPRRYWGAEG